MKNRFSLFSLTFIIFVTLKTTAQTPDSTFFTLIDSTDYSVPYKMEKLFSVIDLSQTQTGFLYNKAIHFVDPEEHKGSAHIESGPFASFETVCFLHHAFKMGWSGLSFPNPLFVETDSLRHVVDSIIQTGVIPITLFYLNFDRFTDNAYTDTLIHHNEEDTLIEDVSGRAASPYRQSFTFATAIAADELEQGTYTLKLPNSLIITNSYRTISQIGIRIGSGSYTYAQPDDDIPFDITGYEGEITVEIRVWYTDGKDFVDFNKLIVHKKPNTTGPYSNINSTSTITIPSTGSHSGAKVTIALGCDKQSLTKPLIIVEPFDPNEINQFSFERTLDLLKTSTATSLALAEFETQGYDIVYVEFNNPLDYMERNARAFKDVINAINTQKNTNLSTEPSVVLGLSTGGVIARYGLREMEIANQNHDTRLLMSIDAPHRGAYMPINLQLALVQLEALDKNGVNMPILHVTGPAAWVDFHEFDEGVTLAIHVDIFNMPQKMRDGLNILKSPAVKQLLVCDIYDDLASNLTITKGLGFVNFPYVLGNFNTGQMHKEFYESYSLLGKLEQCREIGISSGSINQISQQDIAKAPLVANAYYTKAEETKEDQIVQLEFKGLPELESFKTVYIGKIKALSPIVDKWFNVINWEVKTSLQIHAHLITLLVAT